jgi:hypothetical protein
MVKIDYKKTLKELYAPPKTPVIVEVPEMRYLTVDGMGDPLSKEYSDAMQALFPVAYTLKFMVRKRQGIDYCVPPLEGLWWADDMSTFADDRKKWKWTSIIMQPEYVTSALFEEAVEQVKKKKAPEAIDKVRLGPYVEGACAQVMHIGPFSAEGPTVAYLHGFIEKSGYELAGKHHEIYLSDMRKVAPEKMKTVIRQPMAAPK